MLCQFFTLEVGSTKYFWMRNPLPIEPKIAPIPFTIMVNSPCALDRMLGDTDFSMYKEPETLKKSKAIPYMMHDMIIIQRPSVGFPKANRAKRRTQANMLMSMTCLMPKRFMKKGMASMKRVSLICEMLIIMAGYLTANEFVYSGMDSNS